jgi:hypothetical protein
VGKFVNSFHLSSNVEFLDFCVEIYDGGVLFVTSKDELCFFRPSKRRSACFIAEAAFKNSLVRAVDIINGQNSQVAVVSEVTQCDTRSSLQAELFDGFAGGVEGNGHGEKVAVGETGFGDNTESVRQIFLLCVRAKECNSAYPS